LQADTKIPDRYPHLSGKWLMMVGDFFHLFFRQLVQQKTLGIVSGDFALGKEAQEFAVLDLSKGLFGVA
jgi:hypothetical protein